MANVEIMITRNNNRNNGGRQNDNRHNGSLLIMGLVETDNFLED